MEDEVRKHLRWIRILVTLALLLACISFFFTYIVFEEINIPLHRLNEQAFNQLQKKVDYLVASKLDGRLEVGLQMALLDMRDLVRNSTGEVQAQALKAINETKQLLETLQKAKAVPPPQTPEKAEKPAK